MSDATIGCLRFGATSAREVSVTRGRRLPSIHSAAVRAASFLRGTQTNRDDLRSGRVFVYGVRKLLGARSGFYRMLSDSQICLIPYASNATIRPK